MNQESIEELLRRIHDSHESVKTINGWVSSPCPFAQWKHESGKDSNPSFGIKIEDDGPSFVNCFTCQTHGTVSDMLEELQEVSGEDYADLIDEVYDGEVLGGFVPSWDSRKQKRKTESELPKPPDIAYLDIYDEIEDGHWYLDDRGIDAQTARSLDLRIDPDDKGYERILFPVYSYDNVFYGYTGRITNDAIVCKKHPKVRDYFGLKKKFMLLGAHKLYGDDEFVIAVEGLFDYASCHMFSLPSVATMHAGATDQQLAVLKRINKPIVLMNDNDKAGREGNVQIAEYMYKHVPVYGVEYPEGVKDPGALTERQINNMLDDMEMLTSIKEIADFYGYTVRKGKIYTGLS